VLPARAKTPRISFLAFFLMWAERMGWDVPDLHVRICIWLQKLWLSGASDGLLMIPRGHAKSTILGVFNAWLYDCDHGLRILHQGESDQTAFKCARDTKAVLRKHSLTAAIGEAIRGEISFWWVPGNDDERNPSMQAAGIMSNTTSSRADMVQNDDVEVLKNIRTPEARESLRHRLSEQIHIAVPGALTLWVGTPHTHESLYEDIKAMGAECFIARMFEHEQRIRSADRTRYTLEFVPEIVFVGIGRTARRLIEGRDYKLDGREITFTTAPNGLVDFYAGAVWAERFTPEEMEKRRKKCRTLSEWDSQYQLHAKPLTDSRLDPSRITPYDAEPVVRYANGEASMWLGQARIVGAAARWDPSSGKRNSDVSAFAIVLQDDTGRRYLHRCAALTGDVAEFEEDGKTIKGGQVWQMCALVEQFNLPRITVETNGIGTFAPAILRAALKQRRLECAVVEHDSRENKQLRILSALEPLLLTAGQLWAHVSVLVEVDPDSGKRKHGPFWTQMREWNPALTNQPDDYLDAAAGAIEETPERIRAKVGISTGQAAHDWRPTGGIVEVAFER
jgi:hypothetical protein